MVLYSHCLEGEPVTFLPITRYVLSGLDEMEMKVEVKIEVNTSVIHSQLQTIFCTFIYYILIASLSVADHRTETNVLIPHAMRFIGT